MYHSIIKESKLTPIVPLSCVAASGETRLYCPRAAPLPPLLSYWYRDRRHSRRGHINMTIIDNVLTRRTG